MAAGRVNVVGGTVRTGMIHQPHFLPWPGYVARCLAVDTLVLLDNVKFKGGHFQQRTRFVDRGGREQWLTLPVAHATRSAAISEVQVAESFCLRRWERRFCEAYRHQDEFEALWGPLSDLIRTQQPMLAEVTTGTLLHLLDALATAADVREPRVVLASSLTAATDRTQRLVDICSATEITHLVMGHDAIASHSIELLGTSDIVPITHSFSGPPEKTPRAGVTVLHDVFENGIRSAAQRLSGDWSLGPL